MSATPPDGKVLIGVPLQKELQQLLSAYGPPEGLAEELARRASGGAVSELLRRSLDVAEAERPITEEPPFTEMEAVTLVVRLLAVETGDLSGDTVAMPPAEGFGLPKPDGVSQMLRQEEPVLAVLGLLRRRAPEFERGEEPYLRLEALRAMRLQLLPLPRGGPPRWWREEEVGHRGCGETRRILVGTLLRALATVGDGMCHRPKVAALSCLWSLVAGSAHCRSHFMLSDGAPLAVEVLRSQARLPNPPVEAALVAGCGLLTALVKGPQGHARQLVELGADRVALEVLQRFRPHREVVGAAFLLLGALASDKRCAAFLATAWEELEAVAAARERWPEDVEEAMSEALRRAVQPVGGPAMLSLTGPPRPVGTPSPRRGGGRLKAATAPVTGRG